MRRRLGTLVTGLALLAALIFAAPGAAWAGPAETGGGDLCFVEDANIVRYTVPCVYHWTAKYDENGQLIFMHYEDHAFIPPEAAHPATTIHFTVHVDCLCSYDGDYAVTLTPDGEYMSRGPILHGNGLGNP